MIYTSYFANVSKLPNNICAISISAKPPAKWKGPQYKILAPTYEILSAWKAGEIDEEIYKQRFKAEVLDKQKAESVVKILKQIAGKKDVCLCCYEKPEDFCHRHEVSKWLNENGFECKEYEI